MSVQVVNRIEGGQGNDILLSTLFQLCEAAEVSSDFLLGFDRDELQIISLMRDGRAPVSWTPGLPKLETTSHLKCTLCDGIMLHGRPHLFAHCVLRMWERGRSLEYIAALAGCNVTDIGRMLSASDMRQLQASSMLRRKSALVVPGFSRAAGPPDGKIIT